MIRYFRDLGISKDVKDAFAHRGPAFDQLTLAFDQTEYFEFPWIVDGGLDSQAEWGNLVKDSGKLCSVERITIGVATLAIGGAIGYDAALLYWRYIGPNSLDDSPWVVRGWKPPYGNNYDLARDQLQLPKTPTDVIRVQNSPFDPVAGPRTVSGNPRFGSGGGQEWYKGPWFPKNNTQS